MGIAITLSETNRAYTASELAFPVAGASYLNVFGGNTDTLTRNLAIGAVAQPQVVGSPVISSSHAAMTSRTNYVNTGVAQPDDFTLLFVGRPATDNANAAFISNAGSPGPGASLFANFATAADSRFKLTFGVAVDASGTATPNTLTQLSDIWYSQLPSAFMGTYNNTTRVKTLYHLKDGTTTVDAPETNGAAKGKEFLIGGAHNNNFPAGVHAYFAGIWPFVFTQTQRDAAYKWVQDFYNDIHSISL